MPLSPEDRDAVAVFVQSYQQKALEELATRELRWISYLAGVLGIVNLAFLVGLYFMLPGMAAQSLLAQMSGLTSQVSGIIVNAANAQSEGEKAIVAAAAAKAATTQATASAQDALVAAKNLSQVDTRALGRQVDQIQSLFSKNPQATELAAISAQLDRLSPRVEALDLRLKTVEVTLQNWSRGYGPFFDLWQAIANLKAGDPLSHVNTILKRHLKDPPQLNLDPIEPQVTAP